MNNYANKTILVIHPSEIVLRGLSEILKGSLAEEVILLHRADEAFNYPELKGDLIIIATASELVKSTSFLEQVFLSAASLRFISFNNELQQAYSGVAVSLDDSPSMICYKVNEVFNSVVSGEAEPDSELTRREIEVLQLITRGFSNKEIADQLCVSTHTVISHRKNISEKTGIKSASGLTMYAILKKIVDVNEINTSDLV
jgi:DNA-binding NarL/FixJ family response regulator